MKKDIIILFALIGTLLMYGCQIQKPNAVSDGTLLFRAATDNGSSK